MLAKTKSCVLHGLDGNLVDVEVDLAKGIPSFVVVGLPDTSVKESKERVRTAITNAGFVFPIKKVTVNLSPANLKKEGSQLDLPIAISLLGAMEIFKEGIDFTKYCILGELSLDGNLNKIDGALSMIISMKQVGIKKFIIPRGNKSECAVVEGVEIYEFVNLKEIVEYLNGNLEKEPYKDVEDKQIMEKTSLDFMDVKGQEPVKRAVEIAAAGSHNLLMIGPPGSGKSMIAKRIPSILPKLTFAESLEVTKIHSVAGLLKTGKLIHVRQFRAPHHTISKTALVGGGTHPMPGEVSLSHYGVLFLDELPEFKRPTLEVLRQPLEDGEVTITRVNGSYTYPCKFMLIAAMNPCPCGFLGDPRHECTCTSNEISRYLNRISAPLLDRIDLHIEAAAVEINDLQSIKVGESSAIIKKRVEKARKIQINRYKDIGIFSNSELTSKHIEKYCKISNSAQNILSLAYENMKLSARAYHKIIKVARTIADLDDSESIEEKHIAEAIQYRQLDRKYW